MRIIVTGGAGFIGSALVRRLVRSGDHDVLNIDKLTYAGGLDTLASVSRLPGYQFSQTDIAEPGALAALINDFRPDQVFHLAAESHVDRSIGGPAPFVESNVVGTFHVLEAMRVYTASRRQGDGPIPRLLCVSTDEVYGDLSSPAGAFSETSPYLPSSPYAATKAAADHLARAWHRTYDLPVIITNCSNNFGPYQFPEKLIPRVITNALLGRPLPVYGDGRQIRDWLYVDDHVQALVDVMARGQLGETYMIGGNAVMTNIEVINLICSLLPKYDPQGRAKADFLHLLEHVSDRPGHDRCYAVDASKIRRELDWHPRGGVDDALAQTVQWYCSNRNWWESRLEA